MAARELGEAIDAYLEGDSTLQQMSEQATRLGFLMVPRLGATNPGSLSETVNEIGDNKLLVGELGLPPNSGLILATNQLPEAVVAALGGGEELYDPLAPREGDMYGWGRYDDNDGAGDVWLSSHLESRLEPPYGRLGRLIFVSLGGFTERPDYPGHFFIGDSEVLGQDSVSVGKGAVLELVDSGRISWQKIQP